MSGEQAGEEEFREIERADRAWQRQVAAEDTDRPGFPLRGGASLKWLMLAIAAVLLLVMLYQRLEWIG